MSDLFAKYDIPAPRYTSYPTVPYWREAPGQEQWIQHITQALEQGNGAWSLYLHIPFCETLCTFCGCNTIITKDHDKELPYVSLLQQEWDRYLQAVPALKEKPLQHLHLGGGTPTFLTPQSLNALLKPILDNVVRAEGFEASLEADPRRTNIEQLRLLRELGFDRLSLGIQDFNPEVQKLINRVQSFASVKALVEESRAIGYRSVNFDLIYGLAKQNKELIRKTVEQTLRLVPDRIALYSFALVPWIKPAQRLFKEEDLPVGAEKRELYEIAREMLLKEGYVEVGMDHFALPTDALAKALEKKTLHRNFMGYTDHRTDLLLGLGVSSISETPWSFHQNEKVLAQYERSLQEGKIPTVRGHILSEQDRERREQILSLMTLSSVRLKGEAQRKEAQEFLSEMIADGIVQLQGDDLVLQSEGRPFLRNACLFFDEHLKQKQPQAKVFSQSI